MLELSNLLIMWAVVVTAVIALGFYRLLLGMHEDPGSHLEPEEAKQLTEKQAMNRKIARVELFGKSLTVLAVLLILLIVALAVNEALSSGSQLRPPA
jgi:hypothetical protein